MNGRRTWWYWGTLGATPLALAIGWWHADREPEFLVHARVSVPAPSNARAPGESMLPTTEETLLSPEVVTAAANRLRGQGVDLPLESPLDSEVEHLLSRLDAKRERRGDREEFEISYRTPAPESAVEILTAVVETGLKAIDELSPRPEDPAAGGREREREQVAQALQRQQQLVSSLDERLATLDASRSDVLHPTGENVGTLTTALEDARRNRADAEDRLAHARQQLRSGMTVVQVIAGLPEGTTWNPARELAGVEQVRHDLRQKEAAYREVAKVYGANHPRMVDMRSQIEQLRRRLAAALGSPSKPPHILSELGGRGSEALPPDDFPAVATVLLEMLEEKQLLAAAAEEDLDRRIAAAGASSQKRTALEEQCRVARQELGFLQQERQRVRTEIAEAHRAADLLRAEIVEPPTLSPEPIVPSPAVHLAWAGLAGLVVSGVCWRKHRDIRPIAIAPGTTSRAVEAAEVSQRIRSRQEDNLARLKRLKRAA